MNETLNAFISEYERRTNTHQFAQVAELIAEDAVYWFSSGSYRDLSEIGAAFEATWKLIQNEVYTISEVEWLTVGEDSATVLYRYHWKGLIDGKESQGFGRGTNVLRKTKSGWKIVHEHLSPRPKT